MRHQHWRLIVSIAIGIAGVTWPKAQSPLVVWNASRSVPVGFYVVVVRRPLRGEFAALRLPETISSLADERGYLPKGAVLIKRVASLAGDVICRRGTAVTINGCPVVEALPSDSVGRPLPQWSGCHVAGPQQVLVLSNAPGSFDSRYFGLIEARLLIGTATSISTVTVGRPASNMLCDS